MKQWYAVYTKPGWEKKVALTLKKKKIQYFLPVSETGRTWAESVSIQPLFPSWIFVRITEDQKLNVLEVTGVLNYLYWVDQLATFLDSEISILAEYLLTYKIVKLEKIPIGKHEIARVNELINDHTNSVIQLHLPCFGYVLSAKKVQSNLKLVKENLLIEKDQTLKLAVIQ